MERGRTEKGRERERGRLVSLRGWREDGQRKEKKIKIALIVLHTPTFLPREEGFSASFHETSS